MIFFLCDRPVGRSIFHNMPIASLQILVKRIAFFLCRQKILIGAYLSDLLCRIRCHTSPCQRHFFCSGAPQIRILPEHAAKGILPLHDLLFSV